VNTLVTRIEVLGSGLIYRNPKPYLRSVHAYWPDLSMLNSDELLCSLSLASAFESIDCRGALCRSKDGGYTWELQGYYYDHPTDRTYSSTCRVGLMPDGTLIGIGGFFDRSNSEIGYTNPERLGFVDTYPFVVCSTDGGYSWTEPEIFETPFNKAPLEICSPVVECPDGRLLWPASIWPMFDGKCPYGMKAVALVSYDRGRAWPEYVVTMDRFNEGIVHWEQKLIRLDERRMLSMCWTYNLAKNIDLPISYTISEDAGRSFSPPKSTGIFGQTSRPIYVEDGQILTAYRGFKRPGLWANLSRLDGDDWISDLEVPLWGTGETGLIDTEGSKVEQFQRLKFGYPSILRLSQDEYLISFWAVEDCISNIRWFRLRVQ